MPAPFAVPSEISPTEIILEFSLEASARLDEIRRVAGVTTYAKVLATVLSLYAWVSEQDRAGYELALVAPDGSFKKIEFVYG